MSSGENSSEFNCTQVSCADGHDKANCNPVGKRLVNNLLVRCCILVLHCYQWTIGLVIRPACRYQPSCSSYFMDAVRKHGAGKGCYLGLKRLIKCHPWGGAGYDPVPKN